MAQHPSAAALLLLVQPPSSFVAAWARGRNGLWVDSMMLKNTAGQKVGAQMVSATDGSAFTGSVTVSVTVDAGTQAAGTVGSGACTHEGNGYHTYAPSQAETNGDLVAFTFTGTGAIPSTIQSYTRAGDAFTRLGAPAGASVSADIAAIKSETAAILVDTGTTLDAALAVVDANVDAILVDTAVIGAAGAGLTALGDARLANLDAAVSSRLATAGYTAPPTAAANADAVWDEARSGHVTAGSFGEGVASVTGAVGSVTGAVGSVSGNVGGNVVGSVASVTGAVGSVTGNVGGSVVGSVGSVTGNVGGNVVGSVASVTAGVTVTTNNDKTGYAIGPGGIGATAFAAGAIDSASLAADAIGASELAADAASEIASAVLSAAAANPIDANVQEVNDVALTGDGSVTPWGPA